MSSDFNEDASRLFQIDLLSYGPADANVVYNLHSRSLSFLHTTASSSRLIHCGSKQQVCLLPSKPSMGDHYRSRITTREEFVYSCVCVSVCVSVSACLSGRASVADGYFL